MEMPAGGDKREATAAPPFHLPQLQDQMLGLCVSIRLRCSSASGLCEGITFALEGLRQMLGRGGPGKVDVLTQSRRLLVPAAILSSLLCYHYETYTYDVLLSKCLPVYL